MRAHATHYNTANISQLYTDVGTHRVIKRRFTRRSAAADILQNLWWKEISYNLQHRSATI